MSVKILPICTSAPGKAILCGEHAVVHEKTAVAVSLGLRTYVVIEELLDEDEPSIHLDLPDIEISETYSIAQLQKLYEDISQESSKDDSSITPEIRGKLETFARYDGTSKSLAKVSFLYLYLSLILKNNFLQSLLVNAVSYLPIGSGLGSSASFGTALGSALLLLRERHLTGNADAVVSSATINEWAFRSEQLAHGTPSGLDNTASTYGGAMSFRVGQVQRLEKAPTLRLLLTNTNIERSTRVLVAKVTQFKSKYPGVVGPILNSIQGISDEVLRLFKEYENDPQNLALIEGIESLMTANHHLLNSLGVGHTQLDSICNTTMAHGLHSKLTGAGGGGCAITLLRPDTSSEQIEKVKAALEKLGFSMYETDVAGPGVQEHAANQDSEPSTWRVIRSFT